MFCATVLFLLYSYGWAECGCNDLKTACVSSKRFFTFKQVITWWKTDLIVIKNFPVTKKY